MHYGVVKGKLVSTQKVKELEGVALKVVIPCSETKEPQGSPFVAVDEIGARDGDLVLWVGKREASLAISGSPLKNLYPVTLQLRGLSMILGRVRSRVVSTAKLDHFPERPFLSIEPLEGFGDPEKAFIAIDSVQAGPGDLVLVLQEGTGAREAMESAIDRNVDEPLAAQMVVVGVVDRVDDVQQIESQAE